MQPAATRPAIFFFSPTVYQIATAVGLVSLTFFFGGLILAFAFRLEQQTALQRFAIPGLLWFSTAMLAVSGWTLEGARRALRRAHVAVYRGRIAATLLFAALFLGAQGTSARELLAQGIGAPGNPQGAVFYVFMGLHAAHLIGGMGWLGFLHRRARALFRCTETDLRRHRRVAAAAAMYWHFMGAIWLLMFALLHRWGA